MRKKTDTARRARLRKAAQRERTRLIGFESVTFDAPHAVMAKLRAAAPLHPQKTLQAVLVDALTTYAEQTQQSTQDLASIAVKYWPMIRPLLPYLPRLTKPTDPPIRVMGRTYTFADVSPMAPILRSLVARVREQGHSDYVSYLDLLVGGKR